MTTIWARTIRSDSGYLPKSGSTEFAIEHLRQVKEKEKKNNSKVLG